MTLLRRVGALEAGAGLKHGEGLQGGTGSPRSHGRVDSPGSHGGAGNSGGQGGAQGAMAEQGTRKTMAEQPLWPWPRRSARHLWPEPYSPPFPQKKSLGEIVGSKALCGPGVRVGALSWLDSETGAFLWARCGGWSRHRSGFRGWSRHWSGLGGWSRHWSGLRGWIGWNGSAQLQGIVHASRERAREKGLGHSRVLPSV